MVTITYKDFVTAFKAFFYNYNIKFDNMILEEISGSEILILIPRYEYFNDGIDEEDERKEFFQNIFEEFRKLCIPAGLIVNYKIIGVKK